MDEQVAPLGPLSWEVATGETSEHVLVVTGGGDPQARATARRVVLAAPVADSTWSYVDARPPAADPESIVLAAPDGTDVALAQVRVAARAEGGRFDLQVHHPTFADLPEEARFQVTSLALDAALGEVDSALLLGEVIPVEMAPLDGFGLNALASVVRDLKRQRFDEAGRPRWVVLEGETAEGRLLAAAQSPLHPLTAPHLDTYVAVTLPYADRTDSGLPAEASSQALAELEARLSSRLGDRGAVVAHQSCAGSRTLHVYLDSTAGLVPEVKAVARSWSQGRAVVHDLHDPAWRAVAHLRS